MDRETADDIKRHFDVVAEGLRSEMGGLRGETSGLRGEIGDLRVEMGGLRGETGGLRGEVGDLRVEMGGLRGEIGDLRGEIRAVDEKADRRFDATDRRFDATERRFDESDRKFDELKRHFDVVGEALRSDIRLVAEGVAGLDEKFTQEFVTVREEIRDQIGDVKSLIRASYGDLDRRVKPS
jgi:predicted RNase H-like nuclease (RuvC/YqgF family)